MQQLEESLVEGRIVGQSLPRESLQFQRRFSFIVKLEISINTKILEIRPYSATLIVLGGLLVESQEAIDVQKPIIIVIVIGIKSVDLVLIALSDGTQTGTGEIVALVLTH